MRKVGIVSYNIYANFTNYGSALQSWALYTAINRALPGRWEAMLVDYCPEILKDKDPLNPFQNMWDKDEESRRMCELSLPAIRENYWKFDRFYHERFARTEKYTANNFNDIVSKEGLDGFACGSDTIFCIDEFGFDDGYYANYDCMKNRSIAYAASFGDSHFSEKTYPILNERLTNFKALGIREDMMLPYVKEHTSAPAQRVIDPTLLLTCSDYAEIAAPRLESEPYLLLYSRRYSPAMEAYAEKLAQEHGWKIVEISLRATNAERGHRMFYEAGVEEFLSLVKNAEYVVTNSYHGMIFSVQFCKQFVIFSREQCNNKIEELLLLLGLRDRMLITGEEHFAQIDYEDVHHRIAVAREASKDFLRSALMKLEQEED